MAGHNFSKLVYDAIGTDNFTIAAAGTANIYVDMYDCESAHFIVQSLYTSTASSTGITITTYYGMNQTTSTLNGAVPCTLSAPTGAIIGDNGDSVTVATVTPSSSNVSTNHYFTTNDLTRINSRWLRIKIVNADAVNSVNIKCYVEI